MAFRYRRGLKTDEEINEAIDEILSQMTLEEKSGQLCQSVGAEIVAIGSTKIHEDIDELIRAGRIGSMIQVDEPKTMARRIRRYQRLAVEESRLGIPLIFAQDVIHGYETVFPIPLAWSCSFNMDLIRKAVEISGQEAGRCGISMAFSPMLDIAHDPRWGRVSEGAGEDPHLGSEIAKAQVEGFNDAGLLCCLKHFVGYGAAEGGRDYNTTEITDTSLYNTYLKPFKAGIDAGAGAVMSAFNCLNGIPMTANRHMLKDILRDMLGFNGIVITDYSAVMELMQHCVAADEREAALKAFDAGVDIEMTDSYFRQYLPQMVRDGVVPQDALDESVRRVLYAKYRLGLMDDPYRFIREDEIDSFIFCADNRRISRELAEESIVLLENDGALPLTDRRLSVALVGPFSDSTDLCGCWQFSHRREETVTIRQGLEEEGFSVTAVPGTDVFDEVDIHSAVSAARQSDVVIVALGESSVISGEACSRQSVTIPDAQLRLLDAVVAEGKPVVLVVLSGRPLVLTDVRNKVNALVAAFAPGSEGGRAIARIISGAVNPSGHLSMSFPYSFGQIPVHYDELPTGRPYVPSSGEHFQSRYLDGPNAPLYPFGYGLSYSSFRLKGFGIDEHVAKGDVVKVSVTVENVSGVAGKTLVQLYVRDRVASISRPVKELRGFRKVFLAPHESLTLDFELSEQELGFFLPDGTWTVEDGDFDVSIGFSSDDGCLSTRTFHYGA